MTVEDAIRISKILAAAPDERIPMILSVLEFTKYGLLPSRSLSCMLFLVVAYWLSTAVDTKKYTMNNSMNFAGRLKVLRIPRRSSEDLRIFPGTGASEC